MLLNNDNVDTTNLKNDAILISSVASQVGVLATNIGDTKLIFSEFKSSKSNKPIRRELTWNKLKEKLAGHRISSEKGGIAFSPVSYLPNAIRGNKGVENVYCFVADVDNGTPIELIKERITGYGYACLIYTSFSHTLEIPKYRVIIPFSKPIPASMWNVVWHQCNKLLGGNVDPATKDLARMYYMPSHPPGEGGHVIFQMDGRLLDPEQLPQPVQDNSVALRVGAAHPSPTRNSSIAIEGLEEVVSELHPEAGLVEMVKRCKFMSEASKPENQNNISEPLWRAEITNAVAFNGGKAWTHEASCHHDHYVKEKTDAKIRYVNEKGYSPTTCELIRSFGFTGCPSGGCKLPSGKVTKAPAGLVAWFYRPTDRSLIASYQVNEFTVNDKGVFAEKEDKEGEVRQIQISSRIDVVARTRSENNDKWGSLLVFKDPDDNVKKWALSTSMLSGSGEDVRKVLLGLGARVESGMFERLKFNGYLTSCNPAERALSVSQPGWHQAGDRLVYVLNDRVIGNASEQVVLQSADPSAFKIFDSSGSAEDWRNTVASRCVGNSRLLLAVSAALSAPLLHLLGHENTGFHYFGSSSIGKTIALKVAASVWGGGKTIQTWRATSNAIEAIASRHNDSILCLDEMGQVDGKDIGETAYMLGNGQGKARATINAEAREVKKFRLIYFSNGEVAMSDHMMAAGKRTMAGQEVRLINIPADAGTGYGVFDTIMEAESSAAFACQLSSDALQHYGHAGISFVEALVDVEQQKELLDRIREKQSQFEQAYLQGGADSQVGRAGKKFAFVAAIGEVCTELGILPWKAGDAIDGVNRCYLDWIENRGGVGNLEAEQVVERIRMFFEQHGESRFTEMGGEGLKNDSNVRTINRAGFRKSTGDERTEYFVLPEMFKGEICSGLNTKYVTQVLVDRGLLAVGGDGKAQVPKRLPGMGIKRVYHFLPGILGDAVSEPLPLTSVEPQISDYAKRYKV